MREGVSREFEYLKVSWKLFIKAGDVRAQND